ncbi:MAG: DNA-binding response regulator [Proteobacteria bacterium]|nr:DNA-binding response regulator [Pseudomonadota bacterium]
MAVTALRTVLVVDDAPASLGFLCDALATEGWQVRFASSGTAALRELRDAPPDAVLLDAVMPGLSGFAVCERIQGDPRLAGVPVIFMTGLADTAHVLEAFACGAVDYVTKPLRVAEVLARLATHARNARLSRPAPDAGAPLRGAPLTTREAEILGWIAKGKTNRDIADILGISPRTVGKHLEHLFEKLGVETRAAAAALAVGRGG